MLSPSASVETVVIIQVKSSTPSSGGVTELVTETVGAVGAEFEQWRGLIQPMSIVRSIIWCNDGIDFIPLSKAYD